jgi:hypothetical protein
MSIEKSLKKILFSATCDPLCENINCEHAVATLPETGNWFITFGHAGFNSPTNNGRGYRTKELAIKAMKWYQKKRN